jgi:GGDEF domain-containing protein
MLGLEDVTAWTAVGTWVFAAFVVVLAVLLGIRSRRASERRLQTVQKSADRSEELLAELTGNLERIRTESDAARERTARSERETRGLRILGELGSTLVLDDIANRALEHAAEEVGADGAIALLQRGQQEAYTASFGLSQSESERELVGLPPSLNDARAVTIRYRYSAEEVENDAFRLTGGLAVPLEAEGARIGTLAVFWRRTERDPADDDIARLADAAGLLASPLENARRFEETRRLADLDPATGLQSERYFADRLLREVARARRYDRRLALVLLCLGSRTPTTDAVATFGRQLRSAIRSADIPCYLGGGEFAVIAPEAAHSDAERLAQRIRFAALARPQGGPRWAGPGIAELGEQDSAGSLLDRARAAARPGEPEAAAVLGSGSGR